MGSDPGHLIVRNPMSNKSLTIGGAWEMFGERYWAYPAEPKTR
jgi:hypothetical protein